MNLLYTLTTYPPSTGGAQIHQHQLACHLKERHNIQVVAFWDSNRTDWLLGTTLKALSSEKDYNLDGIPVLCMGLGLFEKIFMAPFAAAYYPMMLMGHAPLSPIAAVIEKHLRSHAEMADLVHNVRLGREGLSYASYKAARRNNIPFVLTPVHHPRWVGRKYNAYNKLYTMADAVLALTHAEKEILVQQGVAEERVHVIGHGPVLESAAVPENFLKTHNIDGPMVLFLGQHYPYKGYKELLEAAKIVWQKIPDAHFVFIGPSVGQSESVFKEFQDKRILRLGLISLQEKTDALAACSLLCVPSTQESFGGVYAEAWCFKKPVIGCNIPAVAEVITHEIDGYLVSQDPGEIAEKIIFLLENENAAHQMGTSGKKKVEEKYTWQRIAQRVEKVYNQLI
ncbi:MAG: glycosyltransferase [Candidatus Aminicenantes bacterium]|nr:glycosyltransferase [Candidatus Aminicenantes bacterium]NIM77190.1 glycosyltransferase [Candidatus Aminicenantes bacterium]NIN16483.1 glycosyltransferase [Candidatus Aminicenantes bacterium]NIN40344.1 glycosyltransferase [Candidatus Aminicenantes bacterium]NIN83163.1 glycosyltransferase [Candidatus Aminicenantes bacterium]